ncbi:TetR/AcrR family transcriptional regulator [Conservatibacter flavescens]|nr:TetR family transcriptional regulator [Conservatibacter flavescens]
MDTKTDLRVVRTHNAIRQAFVRLLGEQDYANISIQAICELAPVNRATFYKYYSGKSDLAGKMIADFKQQFTQIMSERRKGMSVRQFMQECVPQIERQSELLLALWKIRTPRHHLYNDMQNIVKQAMTAFAAKHGGVSDYQAHMFAVIGMESLRYHFERRLALPKNGIAKDICEVMEMGELEG